jgi:hypothetical protein
MCSSLEARSVSGRRPLGERGGGFFRANSGAPSPSNPIFPESNAAGRMLYEKLAKHLGFIVYTKEL